MNIENIPTLRVDIEKIGPQGFSAYEIYLQGGGTLSETEWLESLKGETGATPDVQAGETITLQPEEQAQVTRTGTIENPVFTFAIPQGKEGVQGIRGPEGPQGPEGEAGEDGKSAYQIWLDQGNEGTEQDFLNSLVGPEGTGGISLEEVQAITGQLENLSTEDKSNLVNAINEVFNNSGSIEEISGDTDMTTLPYGIYRITAELRASLSVGATKGVLSSVFVENDFVFWDGVKTVIALGSSGGYPRIKIYYVDSASIGREKDVSLSNIVDLTTIQTIIGKKTFTTLPESSATPTTNNQFTNKKYVDDAITNAIGTALGGEY